MIRTAYSLYPHSEVIDIEKIKSQLTFRNPAHQQWSRFGNMFSEEPEEFLYFYKNLTRSQSIKIPRNFESYFPQFFDTLVVTEQLNTKPIEANFTGSFRDYQKTFFETIDFGHDDLLFVQGCGTGKTVGSVYVVCKRKVTTLVLVPTMNTGIQWVNAISKFSDVTNYYLCESVKFTKRLEEGSLPDIMIMTFDLFHSRKEQLEADENFINHWGMIIMDEAHCVGAPTYQPVLDLIPSKYRLALTATFRRGDKMERMLRYHFGTQYEMTNPFPKPVVYPVETNIKVGVLYKLDSIRGGKANHDKNVKIFLLSLERLEIEHRFWHNRKVIELDIWKALELIKVKKISGILEDYGFVGNDAITMRKIFMDIKKFTEDYSMSLVDTWLTDNVKRNRVLLSAIIECIKAGRKILVISKRKEILKFLNGLFIYLGYKSCVIIGETSKDPSVIKYANDEAEVIWGISQIVKEALDIPTLDTLFLFHPMSDMEQACGRIARDLPGKKRPIVVYPYDDYNPYKHMYLTASKVTKQAEFITPVTMDYFLTRIF